jgi:hypothetical protein
MHLCLQSKSTHWVVQKIFAHVRLALNSARSEMFIAKRRLNNQNAIGVACFYNAV